MDDFTKDLGHTLDKDIKQRLNKLVRDNYRYQNWDESNKKVVLDLVKKFKPYLRKGIKISERTIRDESYRLFQNRVKLGLTEEDLKDIKEFLGGLKG
jgi:hypothetical protein